ncbi:hypothetical protein ROA7023_02540 [Roseisalinus antarcticus]|uniref:Uncharacterized protein n=2 Tax=Roseisalinus antarcticus TaxID=254357 RepID=A0A1Y5TAY3_9RHOB|nr:hypothetical protein ROA7023_02540 [Roseisalinus antarcticus]
MLGHFQRIALTGPVMEDNVATIRAIWLPGHIPRGPVTLAIPVHAGRALRAEAN